MKKTTVITVMALLCLSVSSTAQQKNRIRPLRIGDTLPTNLIIENVSNYAAPQIKISDLKGKLVILDFWSTWCGSCIQLFPYLDSLQKVFKNDVQIILVNGRSTATGDDEIKIKKALDRTEKRIGYPISLPSVFDNPLLDDYFPHHSVPHEVWLDSNGVVLAITGPEEVKPGNFKAYLSGQKLSLHQKKDQPYFDIDKPLFVAGNGGDGTNFLYRSIFAPYTEGLKNRQGQVNTANTSRLFLFNKPLSLIVTAAYPEAMSVPANRRLLIGNKAETLMGDRDTSSYYSQYFCYDLIVPATTEANLYKYLRQDLEKTFGLSVKIEKRKVECWSLTTTPNIKKSYTKGGDSAWDFNAFSKHKFMQNQPISTVVQVLNSFFSIPLVDDTGLNKNIDLSLPQNLTDTDAIIQMLKNAGFNLKKTVRELPITVITTLQ